MHDSRKKPSLRQLTQSQRLELIAQESDLNEAHRLAISRQHPPSELVEHWIENPIGYFSLPLGIADHFVIDGRRFRIPLAVEETSIIAALTATAKWISTHGTTRTRMLGNLAIGQIHFADLPDPERTREQLLSLETALLERANQSVPGLVRRGGGFRKIEVRLLDSILALHLLVDTRDAMGANLINQACEEVAAFIESELRLRADLKILSNLNDQKCVEATIEIEGIDAELARKIEVASRIAEADPYRAATHNKGIMNGLDAVVVATGNDWRAVEAGAHAYAARSGRYSPLSIWRSKREGQLQGTLTLPMALGTVGGVTRTHPTAEACLKILGTESAEELARIVCAVGLTQNLAALRALVSEGIVRGHMRLHAGNLALSTEATPEEIPELVRKLRDRLDEKHRISRSDAVDLLQEIRSLDRKISS